MAIEMIKPQADYCPSPLKFNSAVAALFAGVLIVLTQVSTAGAVSTRVVATVNDSAISAYQISQRIKLLKIMRPHLMRGSTKQQQKVALQDLIDEKLKTAEAKKLRLFLPNDRVEKIISDTPSLKSLASRLKSQGLSSRLVNSYIATRMSWNRIISNRYGQQSISDEQVSARTAQFRKELQKQAAQQTVSIYELLQITLPVDRQATPELTNEVARSRLIEADAITRRFKSCATARKATSGVFNVRIGKRLPADPRKMPKQMRRTLDRAGPGSAFVAGVTADRSAVNIMAYCGKRRIAPEAPKITADMVKQRLEDERYENLGKSYLRDLAKNAFIEYKDASLRK